MTDKPSTGSELAQEATVKSYLIVRQEGARQVSRQGLPLRDIIPLRAF